MPLDFGRNDNDPGIVPLHLDRLAASSAIDVQMRSRNPWPERAMRAIWVGFWAALGFAIAGTIWAQS